MKSNGLVDTILLIGQPLLLNAISLPAMAYIIRSLGPIGLGQWMVGSSLTTMAFVLTVPGLRTLFVRRIAQDPKTASEALGEQLGLRIVLACVASLVAVLVCMVLHYSTVVLFCVILCSLSAAIFAISNALNDLLQGLQQFRRTTSVNMAAGLILTAASVVAAWKGLGAVGMAAAYLAGPIATLIMLVTMVQSRFCSVRIVWNPKRFKEMLAEVKVLTAQNFLSTIQAQIEQLMIPKMLGLATFGYFSAGSMPASRLIVFPEGLSTSYYPRISGSVQRDRKLAAHLVAQFMVVSLVVCVPIAILLSFLADPIAHILFPKMSIICRQIIQVTIWSLPVQAIVYPVIYSLQAAGKHSEAAKVTMWSTVAGCFITALLIWRFGILGACASWIVRPALRLVFLAPSFVVVFPEVAPRLPIRRISCCAVLMGGFLWGVTWMHLPAITAVTAGSALAIFLYGAALILTRVVEATQLSQFIRR